ncbi:MAG: hypothetical protein IJ193_02660 [Bacilli bacterium]|nr:hypothetical protein [Bacilli bacterium]
MSPLSIFMLIFAGMILGTGFYIYMGGDMSAISWKAQFKNCTKDDWKNIGKWTMIVGVIPVIIAILAGIFHWS